MKKSTILQMILVVLTVLALTSIAADGGRKFTTTLTGEAEVNAQGVPNQGDLDGIGTATITLNHGQGTVCWEITVSGITLPATAAHIHEAPVTAPGPVVIPLSAPDANGFAAGCTSASREEIKEIIQHPEEYYVNVHNVNFPAGALRGQLSK
jgi:hypothetical protein